MNYYLREATTDSIKKLYQEGLSAQEIKNDLKLSVSTRQLQRWLKSWGLIRTASNAFRLAVKRGKVTYYYKPNKQPRKAIQKKLRFEILERDNFTCVLCSNTAKVCRIEVDHKDNNPTNNNPDNLQTLCADCNKGKYHTIGQ